MIAIVVKLIICYRGHYGGAMLNESHTERVSNVRGVTLLDDEELLFDTAPAWYGETLLMSAPMILEEGQ